MHLLDACHSLQAMGDKLDKWVQENKYVLELIVQDQTMGVKNDNTTEGGKQKERVGEIDCPSLPHTPSLVASHTLFHGQVLLQTWDAHVIPLHTAGQQLLVLSTMWGVIKQNVLRAQEEILGFTPEESTVRGRHPDLLFACFSSVGLGPVSDHLLQQHSALPSCHGL